MTKCHVNLFIYNNNNKKKNNNNNNNIEIKELLIKSAKYLMVFLDTM